jgi:hypothetical protein
MGLHSLLSQEWQVDQQASLYQLFDGVASHGERFGDRRVKSCNIAGNGSWLANLLPRRAQKIGSQNPIMLIATLSSHPSGRKPKMPYEYMVKTKGMSMWDDIEAFGKTLEEELNNDTNSYAELGWELWQTHVINSADPTGTGANGILYVYRRPKPE